MPDGRPEDFHYRGATAMLVPTSMRRHFTICRRSDSKNCERCWGGGGAEHRSPHVVSGPTWMGQALYPLPLISAATPALLFWSAHEVCSKFREGEKWSGARSCRAER